MRYLKCKEAAKLLGVHPNSLRNWDKSGAIKTKRTPGGQRLYAVDELTKEFNSATVCYCRVSSTKQKDDLERQVAYLQEKYPEAEVVKDIGSGINFKRKGLNAILERLLCGEVLTLVVAHRDRLARFGFELIQFLVERNGGKVVVLDQTAHSPEAELTRDILTILHVFSCRLHGLRKYKDKIKEDTLLPDSSAAEDPPAMDGDCALHIQQNS